MFGIGSLGHKQFPPSLEYPMQKPPSRLRDTEDPIPITGSIQNIEVVAGLPSPVPPLAGDSLRSPDVVEPMDFTAIGERYRFAIAAFRGSDNDFDGTRLTQQPERAKKINRAPRSGASGFATVSRHRLAFSGRLDSSNSPHSTPRSSRAATAPPNDPVRRRRVPPRLRSTRPARRPTVPPQRRPTSRRQIPRSLPDFQSRSKSASPVLIRCDTGAPAG